MKKQVIVAFALTAVLGSACPAMTSHAAWKADSNGRWYSEEASPGYAVGWRKIGKYTYYFTKSKYAVTGWRLIHKKWYFFDPRGRLVTNRWVDGYYVTADGSMAINSTVTTPLGSFRVDEEGHIIPDDTNDSGTAVPGQDEKVNCWVEEDGIYYYYNYKGKLSKGWLTIKDQTYYLDPATGARRTGWLKADKKYYYLQPDTGLMTKGWTSINSKTYYFNSNGTAAKGWKKIDGYYYYFNKKGRMYTNRMIKNKYYLDADGRRAAGFRKIGEDTYYFSNHTGKMVKGWAYIKPYQYYFYPNGKMATDCWIDGRYLKSNGRMATKCWAKQYYVNKHGYRSGKIRSTGLWKKKSKTYFLDENYEKVKSQWVSSGGKYYYMDEKGVMVVSQWIDGYYIGANGARVTNLMGVVGGKTYLFKSDGTKATGIVNYKKKTYLFDRNGVMVTGWYNNTVATFYFLPGTGEMIKNQTVIINNVYYYFDKNGHMTNGDNLNSDLALGMKIAAYAQQFIGNPYVYGGNSLTDGVDCSGFTQQVMKHFDISIPRVADQQALGSDGTPTKYATAKIISVQNIQPGDLVFYYSPISHVGIYIGDGKIVHASNSAAYPQGGIKISPYNYATIRAIVRYW